MSLERNEKQQLPDLQLDEHAFNIQEFQSVTEKEETNKFSTILTPSVLEKKSHLSKSIMSDLRHINDLEEQGRKELLQVIEIQRKEITALQERAK